MAPISDTLPTLYHVGIGHKYRVFGGFRKAHAPSLAIFRVVPNQEMNPLQIHYRLQNHPNSVQAANHSRTRSGSGFPANADLIAFPSVLPRASSVSTR